MSDEEIIMKGAEAIDTLRIHRSLEFVDLVMKVIARASEKLEGNRKLKEALSFLAFDYQTDYASDDLSLWHR
jgi:hypothetical protein